MSLPGIASILFLLLVYFTGMPPAASYYIDFQSGNDGRPGTSPATAWKRCPGDPLAAGVPAATALQPGDTVLFKGGVIYRGQIRNTFSGSMDRPIVFRGDGWPGLEGVKAVIDGTELYDGTWTRCQSAAECGGNPNWQNICYSSYSGSLSPYTQFFDHGERVYLAQTPDLADPFWDDRFSEYLPVTPAGITLTSITDPSFLTQTDIHHWDGAYIQIWVVPNVIAIRKVTGFNPATHTIFFETLPDNALYGDRNQYYSLVNQIHALDRAGELVVDEAAGRIWYWPAAGMDTMNLEISIREYGFNTRGRSHLVIECFLFRGFTSDDAASAIRDDYTGTPGQGLLIQNNEVCWVRTRDGRKGSISIYYTNGVTVRDNVIHHCQRNSGLLFGTDDLTITGNEIYTVGYKGLWFMGVKNARVLENRFADCAGTHGNPVSIFTSENVLVAHNIMYGDSEVLTYEGDHNLVIHNNIIHSLPENGEIVGSFVLRENGDNGTGYHVITQNTILNSATHFALGIGTHAADPEKLIIRNNIADGGGNFLGNTISHNLYTGLSWMQKNPSWHLSTGELIETDLTLIFRDPDLPDLHLLPESPARDAGTGLKNIIPADVQALFPGFDFRTDLDGRQRGLFGLWDMGAYEYSEPADFNLDGRVDALDLALLAAGLAGSRALPEGADLVPDGVVDTLDLLDLLRLTV